MNKNKLYRAIWISIGFICFGIGTIGVFLPFLPSFPFYMATLIAFTKSSEKLRTWFVSTKLYKKNLESYVTKKSMTVRTKLYIMTSVTLVMGFGFLMMSRVPVGRVVLAIVWLGHILYFIFGVKTEKEDGNIEETKWNGTEN